MIQHGYYNNMSSGHHKYTRINDELQKEEKISNGEKRLMKGSSHGNLAHSLSSHAVRRSSIRRSKTDCDLRSLLLSDSLATRDYVTPYLRMKMQQRLKHKHGSKFSLHSSSSFGSSSIRSSQSTITEQILHRSSKEVCTINYIIQACVHHVTVAS